MLSGLPMEQLDLQAVFRIERREETHRETTDTQDGTIGASGRLKTY